MEFKDRLAVWRGRRAIRQAAGNERLDIGKGLKLYCKLYFTGPGSLVIGEGVTLRPSFFDSHKHVTLCTYHPDARLVIGNGCLLEGTRFGCREEIILGAGCYIGDAGIMDTDFHSTHPDFRNDQDMVRTRPLRIGDGARIASHCVVLPGTTVGEGAVVRPNSIVSRDVPPHCTALGFPARPQKVQA